MDKNDRVIAADALNIYGYPIPRRLNIRNDILDYLLRIVISSVELIEPRVAPFPNIRRMCVIDNHIAPNIKDRRAPVLYGNNIHMIILYRSAQESNPGKARLIKTPDRSGW